MSDEARVPWKRVAEFAIREDDKFSKVVVYDTKTGYAVAQFFYQADKDRQPRYDAHKMAVRFCVMYNTSKDEG